MSVDATVSVAGSLAITGNRRAGMIKIKPGMQRGEEACMVVCYAQRCVPGMIDNGTETYERSSD